MRKRGFTVSNAQLTPQVHAPLHIENSTDATRGEPIVPRVQARRAELQVALQKLAADELRARNDIQLALSSVDALLTGDLEKLSDVTAFELNRWLEHTKHLAEIAPPDATTH
jgi:hypothetical protein